VGEALGPFAVLERFLRGQAGGQDEDAADEPADDKDDDDDTNDKDDEDDASKSASDDEGEGQGLRRHMGAIVQLNEAGGVVREFQSGSSMVKVVPGWKASTHLAALRYGMVSAGGQRFTGKKELTLAGGERKRPAKYPTVAEDPGTQSLQLVATAATEKRAHTEAKFQAAIKTTTPRGDKKQRAAKVAAQERSSAPLQYLPGEDGSAVLGDGDQGHLKSALVALAPVLFADVREDAGLLPKLSLRALAQRVAAWRGGSEDDGEATAAAGAKGTAGTAAAAAAVPPREATADLYLELCRDLESLPKYQVEYLLEAFGVMGGSRTTVSDGSVTGRMAVSFKALKTGMNTSGHKGSAHLLAAFLAWPRHGALYLVQDNDAAGQTLNSGISRSMNSGIATATNSTSSSTRLLGNTLVKFMFIQIHETETCARTPPRCPALELADWTCAVF
jgi:hypothetical protein